MKQIQEDQELKEIETKKSAIAVQFVHPQIRAQRNRVQKSKHFRCSKVLALSSKMRALDVENPLTNIRINNNPKSIIPIPTT